VPILEEELIMDATKKTTFAFALLELLIGSTVGYFYINSFDGENKDLNQSIIECYLTLNALFLGTTLILGTLNVGLLGKWEKLGISILISILSGFFCLFIYAVTFSFLSYTLRIRLTPLFFSLIGFVFGFNFGLLRKVVPKSKE
jgi:hypothetical protein